MRKGAPVPVIFTRTAGAVRFVLLAALTMAAILILQLAGRPDRLGTTAPASMPAARFADFHDQWASPDARHIADWVADSSDSAGAGFIIVDKPFATIYVFDADARLRGSSPILLGAAAGDESVPGIGSRPLAEVRPQEKTTPAGRFVAERGHNTRGEDIVWVDYDAAVSMHRVRATNPRERRLERLETPTILDNRISFGCINVPVVFYEEYVRPVFAPGRAIVYVLPDVRPVREVFGSYDVGHRREAAADMTSSGE